jgi:hypothetical protein
MIGRYMMNKDQMKKDGEISAEDLEKVSGGIAAVETRIVKGLGGTSLSPNLNPQPDPPMNMVPGVTIPDHK